MKSIIFGDLPVSITDSIYITIVSLLMVFFILVLISFLLSLFRFIPQEIEKTKIFEEIKEKVEEHKKIKIEDIKDEEMLIALMVASIESAKDEENTFVRIKSIKEIK